MHILVTNDDGVHSEGLAALAGELARVWKVSVVAPAHERSGVAHSITIHSPLVFGQASLASGLACYTVNGTPADCVKLACWTILDEPVDMVVSGINLGANVGVNVLYSGTVAAAVEGAMLGVPSVAVSLEASDQPDFARAARMFRGILETIVDSGRKLPLVNVNIPALGNGPPKGVRITSQCCVQYSEGFDERTDPRGRKYYWLEGDVDAGCAPDSSDLKVLSEGYVSVTPLRFDLTDYERVEELSDMSFNGLMDGEE